MVTVPEVPAAAPDMDILTDCYHRASLTTHMLAVHKDLKAGQRFLPAIIRVIMLVMPANPMLVRQDTAPAAPALLTVAPVALPIGNFTLPTMQPMAKKFAANVCAKPLLARADIPQD